MKSECQPLKILHLCTYYVGSVVYKNLFKQLARESVINEQYIWIPVRDEKHRGLNASAEPGVHYIYNKCLSLLTRLSFLYKVVRLIVGFQSQARLSKIIEGCNIIHAHTLYSDGFLAYFLSRRYRLPYVLSIRTTDVSIFERCLPQWRFMTRRIIKNARCLIFISPAHKRYIELSYSNFLPRTLLLPNGVDDFWIKNSLLKRPLKKQEQRQGIYIGEINKNKNIRNSILAFFEANCGVPARFTVVGGGYQAYRTIFGDLAEELIGKVTFVERTQDKNKIMDLLRHSQVLVMPSYMETFGLTYLEAISQCVPVVYSRHQGIDGLYPEGSVGFSCNPAEQDSIAMAISLVFDSFPEGLVFSERNPVCEFSWEARAKLLLSQAY